jgi:lactoylglutathione lyase
MNISFITIQTRDITASVKFYEKILDFQVIRKFCPGPGIEIVFMDDKNDNKIEFIKNDKAKPFSGEGISIGFYVDDIYKIEKHLKDNKVNIVNGPILLKSGVKLLSIKDNNGVELGFVQEK